MDFLVIAYVLVSVVLITGTFYINYSSGRTTTAGILGFGCLAASIFFGIRWFPGGSLVTKKFEGPWPPSVNVCPDFLSLTKVGGKAVCVDTVGVSRRKNNGGMAQWTDTYQSDAFNLHLDVQGTARLSALYAECKARGVTWEGVWDGTVGLGREPPLPPP